MQIFAETFICVKTHVICYNNCANFYTKYNTNSSFFTNNAAFLTCACFSMMLRVVLRAIVSRKYLHKDRLCANICKNETLESLGFVLFIINKFASKSILKQFVLLSASFSSFHALHLINRSRYIVDCLCAFCICL